MANDFPVRKEELHLRGIGKVQRTQKQARRFECRGRGHAPPEFIHS